MLRKNTAGQNLGFVLVDATTGGGKTGATVTAYRSIDGGAQASATGTVTELGNGQYNFAPSQADTNGNQISYLFTASGAVPVEKTVVTTAADPTNATSFGLTNLDATVSGVPAAVWGATPRTLTGLSFTVAANVTQWAGSAVGGMPNSGNVTVGGYAAGQDPATLVLDATASAHNTTGTVGHAINAAGTAGDPWATTLPGSYTGTEAGAIVGALIAGSVFGGTAAAGTNTTLTFPAGFPTYDLTGYRLSLDNGTAAGYDTVITAYNTGTGVATFAALPNSKAPDNTTKFTVLGPAPKYAVGLNAADVTGNLPASVAAYAVGQDPGTYVLATPAHKLATDASGDVAANNLPADYQQRNVAVTLPAIPAGWITGTGVAAAALNGKGDWNTVAPDNADIAAIKAKTDTLPTTFPAVDGQGHVSLSLTQALAARNQDGNTAPTVGDALQGAWTGAFAGEVEDDANLHYKIMMPDGTTLARTFTTTLDTNGNPVTRA